jgi:hypothetical protein
VNLNDLARRSTKFAADNSPLILTSVGVAGTIATAYLAGKASWRACRILEADAYKAATCKDKFLLVWKLYIPAAGVGVLTTTCIIGANRIGTRRAAALATAMTLSERAFMEYRDKVIETIGATKEQKVRDEVAQDRVTKNDSHKQIVISGVNVLCYDMYSDRYFESTMEDIKHAQNKLNHQLVNGAWASASLNDWYSYVGLDSVTYGEEVGWNSSEQVEITFSSVVSGDGRPALAVDFDVAPVRNYFLVH